MREDREASRAGDTPRAPGISTGCAVEGKTLSGSPLWACETPAASKSTASVSLLDMEDFTAATAAEVLLD